MSSNIFNQLMIKKAYALFEKENLKLFRWAFNFDVYKNQIFRKQEVLFRSSQYRIIAIDKICKSFECKNVGISNMNLINSLNFKLYLFYKLKKPKKHIFVLTNKLYTKKSNCKKMSLDIQIIINRCLQQLL